MTLSSDRLADPGLLRGSAAGDLDVVRFGDVRPAARDLDGVRGMSPRVAAMIDVEGEQVRLAAHEQGFAAGYADGLAKAAAELAETKAQLVAEATQAAATAAARADEVLLALTDGIESLPQRLTPTDDELGQTILEAAYVLAEAVVAHDVAASATGVRDVVLRSLSKAPDEVEAVVLLAPEDLEALGQLGAIGARNVRLVADPSVSRGGCVVECGPLRVDARVESALARAKAVLQP
jgi:flagellar assembly protein FliH